jgi:NAD+ diphosphatase
VTTPVTTPASLNGFYASPVAINTDKKWIIAVVGRDILLAGELGEANNPLIDSDATNSLSFFCQRKITLGQWHSRDCEVWDLIPEATAKEGFSLIGLRDLLTIAGEEVFSLACRAVQLLYWQDTHRFCGSCGKPNQATDKEHAMTCHECNIKNYPRISPCVIVLVTRGDHCLLARNVNWPANQFSALAGFLEAGESAEQALHREVFEEVGVEIDNIRYVGSQSWPFPGQLMLGFIADAVTDEIKVDGIEIVEADWFRYDQLPGTIAPPGIMSGRLIQTYVEQASLDYGLEQG